MGKNWHFYDTHFLWFWGWFLSELECIHLDKCLSSWFFNIETIFDPIYYENKI